MIIKDTRIVEFLKNLKPQDFIYSGVLILFVIIVGIVFFISTRFISENINKIFSSESTVGAQILDIARYQIVAKKLGIPTTNSEESIAKNFDVANANIASTTDKTSDSSLTASTTEQNTKAELSPLASLDKSKLTITILNSTAQAGRASALSKALEEAGYNKAKTGNQKTKLSTTTITVKEIKSEYLPSIEQTVRILYPSLTIGTVTEYDETDPDIIIVIGER